MLTRSILGSIDTNPGEKLCTVTINEGQPNENPYVSVTFAQNNLRWPEIHITVLRTSAEAAEPKTPREDQRRKEEIPVEVRTERRKICGLM